MGLPLIQETPLQEFKIKYNNNKLYLYFAERLERTIVVFNTKNIVIEYSFEMLLYVHGRF